MAPIPLGNWRDEMSEELFGYLFGMSVRTDSGAVNACTDGFEIFSKK